MLKLDEAIQELPGSDEGPIKIKRYPCLIPDPKWPALVMDNETIRVWCELDEDFYATLLSPIGELDHTVSWSLDGGELDGFLDSYSHYYHREWRATRAMSMGLTYHQPFYVELYAHYYIARSWEGDECDCNTSFEILHVKALPPNEVMARWQEWLNRI